ncbi:MAG: HlyD family efflux transporter periplasmic adaptor subunit [Pseudomonadota bacterium]
MDISMRTVGLLGVGAAVIAVLAYVSFREEPVPVDLAEVTRGPLEITVNADGKTQVRDLYEVAAPIAGTAMRAPVDVGDDVVEGETVVAVVRPASSALLDERTRLQAEATLREAEASRNVAAADLVQAEESRDFAETQLERTKALVTRGVASLTRLEDDSQRLNVSLAAHAAAEARLAASEGAVARARASLIDPAMAVDDGSACCVEIRAPANGVIMTVAAVSQRPVTIGSPLVSVGNPDDLEIVADILSSDAVRLSEGAVAHVERWGGTDALEARLDRIDPRAETKVSALGIEEQRVDAYFTLVSPVEDRPGLRDGFSVFLRIVEWRSEDALQIPLSAIFRDGLAWAVFVAEGDVASLRPIEIGRRNGQMTEVLGGLEPGERVVLHPSDDIETGAKLIERSNL